MEQEISNATSAHQSKLEIERKKREEEKEKKTAGFEPSTFQFPNSAAVLQLEPKAIAELLSYKNFKRS